MIREIGGTNGRLSCSRTFRDDTGHAIKVSVQGTVPTNGSLVDGQAGQPAPNITVEDLGYPQSQAAPAELPGTNDPFAGRGYQAARGCAPRPEGAPKAEDAIAIGRGHHPDAVLSAAGNQGLPVLIEFEAMKVANAERDRRGEAQAYPEQAFRDLLAKANQVQPSGLGIMSEAERQSCKFYQVQPQPPLPKGVTTTNVEGTDYVLSEAGKQAQLDEVALQTKSNAPPMAVPMAVSLSPSWGWSCACGGRNAVKPGILIDECIFCHEKSRIPEGALTTYQARRRPTEDTHA